MGELRDYERWAETQNLYRGAEPMSDQPKCPKCGGTDLDTARDMVGTQFCTGCRHEWVPAPWCASCGSRQPGRHGKDCPLPAAPEAWKCKKCGEPIADHIPFLEQTSGPPYKSEFRVSAHGLCPTPPLAGLDFEKAMKDAREYKGMGFGVANTYEAFLNAQLREAVERAVAEERKRPIEFYETGVLRTAYWDEGDPDVGIFAAYRADPKYDELAATLKAERAKHAALVKAVREWQEGRKESYLTESLGTHSLKHVKAAKALAALDLGPEGANG